MGRPSMKLSGGDHYLQEMKARNGPLGKLVRLYSKKKVSAENGSFLTCFRGWPILDLPLLLN